MRRLVLSFDVADLREGRVTMTFMGDSRQVGKFLRLMGKLKISYKISSLADASFPPSSALNVLTEKQRRVLITAYRLGYYDLPKRISSRELAEKLGMQDSTPLWYIG